MKTSNPLDAFEETLKEGKKKEAFNWWRRHRYLLEYSHPQGDIQLLRRSWALQPNREPILENGANVAVPILRMTLSALAERLFVAHFNQTPFVLLEPVNTDRTEAIKDLEAILFWYQNRDLQDWSLIIRDGVLLGTGVGYKVWDEGRPKTKYIPLEDVIVYPNTVLENVWVIGHTLRLSVPALYRMFPNADPAIMEKAKVGLGAVEGEDMATVDIPQTGWGVIAVQYMTFIYDGDYYEIVYLPVFGDVLRFQRLPFRFHPYIFYTPIRGQGLFGESLGRLLLPIEGEINEIHNLILDNALLTNLPVFIVRRGSSASKIKEWRAGMLIETETPQDIAPLVVPQNVNLLQQREMTLLEYAKAISGYTEIMSGQPPSPYHTAYAIEASLLEGSVRFKHYFANGRDCLRRNAILDLLMIREWGDRLGETKYLNRPSPLVFITPEEIISEDEWRYLPNTANINRETDKQRWLMIKQLFQQQLTPQGQWEIDAIILRNMGVINPETILGEKPKEPQQSDLQTQQMPLGMIPPMLPPQMAMGLPQSTTGLPLTPLDINIGG